MNAKEAFIALCVGMFLVCVASYDGYRRGAANTRDNTGIERNLDRERELLARIGEYEQRERDRIARENSRIERERERVERTKASIAAIRGLDRRSGDLLQELEQEISILADYLNSSERELGNYRWDGVGDNAAVEIGE